MITSLWAVDFWSQEFWTIELVMLIIWVAIIILTFIVEINTFDLVSIWFSLGAIIAFIAGLFGVDVVTQVAIFFITTIVLLIITRPLIKKYMVRNKVKTNADNLVGKIAKVTKEIIPGERGEVKIDGKYWLAISNDTFTLEIADPVRVLGIEGVKLIVSKKE